MPPRVTDLTASVTTGSGLANPNQGPIIGLAGTRLPNNAQSQLSVQSPGQPPTDVTFGLPGASAVDSGQQVTQVQGGDQILFATDSDVFSL